MNWVMSDSPILLDSREYQDFIQKNQGSGNLKIRAYAASEALPVGGLSIRVSTKIGNYDVIFFQGKTDASGMIQTISLPTPVLDANNLIAPSSILYVIEASSDALTKKFVVSMYDGICVVQNINFIKGDSYGG